MKYIVSINSVCALRNAFKEREPDPVHFALEAELAGAAGIHGHLRIDRNTLSEQDADLLIRQVKTCFYLQVSPHQDIVHLINNLRPQCSILSAERRESRDSSLDVSLLSNELQGIVRNIDAQQTKVFVFVDPQLEQVKATAKMKAHGVVLNTKDLFIDDLHLREKNFSKLKDAVKLSRKYGLTVHLSGNVRHADLPELSHLDGVTAIHLGHQLVSRSLHLGIHHALRSFTQIE